MREAQLHEILGRLAGIIGSTRDTDIAKALGCGRSTLSTWRRRSIIPYEQIAVFCLRNDVPLVRIFDSPERSAHSAPATQHRLAMPAELSSTIAQLIGATDSLTTVLDRLVINPDPATLQTTIGYVRGALDSFRAVLDRAQLQKSARADFSNPSTHNTAQDSP